MRIAQFRWILQAAMLGFAVWATPTAAQLNYPPPDAPPPAPPQPMIVMDCFPGGPYIVFFEWNKSDLMPEALAILDNVAAPSCHNAGTARIELVGHADRSGPSSYNLRLSKRRARAVAVALGRRGLRARIDPPRGMGESDLRVPTGDGVREIQNRRVVITYN